MVEKEIAYVLWGKLNPYKSLLYHMIDAGMCAKAYLQFGNKSLLKTISDKTNFEVNEILPIIGYFVACHDIGKAHPSFQLRQDVQNEIPEKYRRIINPESSTKISHSGFRHEIYSVKVLRRIWEKKNYSDFIVEEVTCVIADHHQKRGKGINIPLREKNEYEKFQDILEDELNAVFCPKVSEFECYDWSLFCESLNGILVLSDWIASNPLFMDNSENYKSVMEYAKKSDEYAKKVIESIGFSKCITPYSENLYEMFSWKSSDMRPMQELTNSIVKECPQFTIIEDSPGSGKTEAAVFLALSMAKKYNKSGLYFALPTAATANQMWERLNSIFSKYNIPNFRLIHGMAWSIVEENGDERNQIGSENEIGDEWLRPSRKALLSQYAVGTVDQVMMAVINIRFRQLRMLGLTDKVLIIDEVHAYDAYMSTILDRLLEWCGVLNIPVIMLSATLPKQKKQDYINSYFGINKIYDNQKYPLITFGDSDDNIVEKTCESSKKCIYKIETLECLNNLNFMVEKSIELVNDGGNLCLMLNTVKDAQYAYSKLKEIIGDNNEIKVLLYHARYKTKDRIRIEQECLRMYSKSGNRPLKSILVCTQVVEQSLDVDFDIMMTQICPIDLLIQRMGRIWRHNNKRPKNISEPIIYVATGDFKQSSVSMVYSTYILKKTQEYVKQKKEIHFPGDLRDAISYVYESNDDTREFLELYFDNANMGTMAEGVEIEKPDAEEYFLVESDPLLGDDNAENLQVATRLGRKTTRVALCSEKEEKEYRNHPKDRILQNNILENSVALSVDIPYDFCEKSGVLKGVYVAIEKDGYYFLPENYVVEYDEEKGTVIERR